LLIAVHVGIGAGRDVNGSPLRNVAIVDTVQPFSV